MENLAENNIIRFTNITQKKGVLFANFKVKGIKNGVIFTASISVDLSALELHPGDPLEKIIEHCAKQGLKEFKKADFRFEHDKASSLGVAQLG
jgi:hypothetical protein